MNEVKSKRLTIPILQKRLDQVFSEYIKFRDASDNGYCTCVTCGSIHRWNDIQNGHYISRQYIATRYDSRNCHPQCNDCNVGKRGNLDEYKRFIIKKYGVKVLAELEEGKRALAKWGTADYQEKIAYYRKEVRRLRKEKGL